MHVRFLPLLTRRQRLGRAGEQKQRMLHDLEQLHWCLAHSLQPGLWNEHPDQAQSSQCLSRRSAWAAQGQQMERVLDDLEQIHFSMKKANQVLRDMTRGIATDRRALLVGTH